MRARRIRTSSLEDAAGCTSHADDGNLVSGSGKSSNGCATLGSVCRRARVCVYVRVQPLQIRKLDLSSSGETAAGRPAGGQEATAGHAVEAS